MNRCDNCGRLQIKGEIYIQFPVKVGLGLLDVFVLCPDCNINQKETLKEYFDDFKKFKDETGLTYSDYRSLVHAGL